jgi:hypothetical protein
MILKGEPVNAPLDWLLDGPGWIRYRTRLDLLKQPEEEMAVATARDEMIRDPNMRSMISDLNSWPGYPLQRHNDAKHPIHKLVFLADLGFRATDPGLSIVVDNVKKQRSEEGVFQVLVNIPTRFGGSGEDEYAWMLCDAPLILYSLVRLGLSDDRPVRDAMDYLVGLVEDFGWPCAAAPRFGRNFRGPGKKGSPCPYANLVMLRALSQLPGQRDSNASREGVRALLDLWRDRKERRPFLFAMGTHFNRLKAPLIWYDILHVLDVLSQFPIALEDPRLGEMIDLLLEKIGNDGRFTAESIWKAWSDWEFGQKKMPSMWITLLSHRIMKRMGIQDS